MALALTAILLAYSILVIVLITGWQKAIHQIASPVDSEKVGRISILIAFRNEEQHLVPLLSDLVKQTYPDVEVILIDDHSTDRSVEVIQRFVETHKDFPLRLGKNSSEGKKAAITAGVHLATGSVSATLDADCRVGPNWLKSLHDQFGDGTLQMLIGPVSIQGDGTFFSSVQSMEFASLVGSGAATAAWGFPTMCNGANLAFRKHAFLEVGGYEGNLHIPSGDDEFLMRKIAKRYPGSVRFNAHPESISVTKPVPSIGSFIQQRIRWAAKWKYNSSLAAKLLALFIFVVQISILLAMTMLSIPLLTGLGARAMVEFIFLRKILAFLRTPWSWRAFIFLQVVYPLYVVAIAIISNFLRYQWKGRRY